MIDNKQNMKQKQNKRGIMRKSTAASQKKRRTKINQAFRQKAKQKYCMLHNKNSFIKNTNDGNMDQQVEQISGQNDNTQKNQSYFGGDEVQLRIKDCLTKKQKTQNPIGYKSENNYVEFLEDDFLKKLKAEAPEQRSESDSSNDGIRSRPYYHYDSDQWSQLSQINMDKIKKKQQYRKKPKSKTAQWSENQSEGSKLDFLDPQHQKQIKLAQNAMILRPGHRFSIHKQKNQSYKYDQSNMDDLIQEENDVTNHLNPNFNRAQSSSSGEEYADVQRTKKKVGRPKSRTVQTRQKQKESNLKFRISRGICPHFKNPDYGQFRQPQLCADCLKQFKNLNPQISDSNIMLLIDRFLQQKFHLKVIRKYAHIYDGFVSFKVQGYKFQKRKFTPVEQLPPQFFIFEQQYQKFYEVYDQQNPKIIFCPHKKFTKRGSGNLPLHGMCSKCFVRFFYLKNKDIKAQDLDFIKRKQYRQDIDKYIREEHYKIFQSLLFPIKRQNEYAQLVDQDKDQDPLEEIKKALKQKHKWDAFDGSNPQIVNQHMKMIEQRKAQKIKQQAQRKKLKIYPQINLVKVATYKTNRPNYRVFTCIHYSANTRPSRTGLCYDCYSYYKRYRQQRNQAKKIDGKSLEDRQQSADSLEDYQNYNSQQNNQQKEGQPKEQGANVKKIIDFRDFVQRREPSQCHPKFLSVSRTGYCLKCLTFCIRKWGRHMDLYPTHQEMGADIYKYFNKVKVLCPHPQRKLHGHGLCRKCYRKQYGKVQRQRFRIIRKMKQKQLEEKKKKEQQQAGQVDWLIVKDNNEQKKDNQKLLQNQAQPFIKTQFAQSESAGILEISKKKFSRKRGLQLPEQLIQEKGLIRVRQFLKKNDKCGHYDKRHCAKGYCFECFNKFYGSTTAIKKFDKNHEKFERNVKWLNRIRQLRQLGKLPIIKDGEDQMKQEEMKKQERQQTCKKFKGQQKQQDQKLFIKIQEEGDQ